MEIMTMVGMIMMNMVQAPKEEVAPMSMAMGPPPSRKMTRTPPVYQQVDVFVLSKACFALSKAYLWIMDYFRRRGEATKKKLTMAGETVSW